jgi:hypothetical protein
VVVSAAPLEAWAVLVPVAVAAQVQSFLSILMWQLLQAEAAEVLAVLAQAHSLPQVVLTHQVVLLSEQVVLTTMLAATATAVDRAVVAEVGSAAQPEA